MVTIARCARSATWTEAMAASLIICSAVRQPSTTAASSVHMFPVFDFLLPSLISRSSTAALTPSPTAVLAVRHSAPVRMRAKAPLLHRRCHKPHVGRTSFLASIGMTAIPNPRFFSTSQRRHNTHTAWNPQLDESGKEMRLEITPRAAKRLSKVMKKDGNPHLALRIQVESGGCHGFQYLMSLVTLPDSLPAPPRTSAGSESESELPTIRNDDTIFTYISDDGETALNTPDPLFAPKIILDTPSLELLNGSKVDFTMELIGSQFKIVDNPLATSSCGCGTSFDIKI